MNTDSLPADQSSSPDQLVELLDRLTKVRRSEIRSRAARFGLPAVQLEALRYLASCNRYSDTPAAVAAYLDTTRGTVSQTLITLERKGLLNKRTDPADGRVVHCTVSRAGHRILGKLDDKTATELAITALEPESRGRLHDLLRQVVHTAVVGNEGTSFDRCERCANLQSGDICSLTGEALEPDQQSLLCRMFTKRSGPL